MQDSMLLAPHGAHTVLVPGYLAPEKLAQGFRLLWELPAELADRTPAMLDVEAAHRGAQAFLAENPNGLSCIALMQRQAQVKEATLEPVTGAAAAAQEPPAQAAKRKPRKGGQ